MEADNSSVDKSMRMVFFITVNLIGIFFPVFAVSFSGVFQTEPSEKTGGVLHVEFGACEEKPSLFCGTIKKAIRKDGSENKEYENLGKLIVWDMIDTGNGKFKKGRIWKPDENNDNGTKKIFKSKMAYRNDVLLVEGCILFFCKSQEWKRVQSE